MAARSRRSRRQQAGDDDDLSSSDVGSGRRSRGGTSATSGRRTTRRIRTASSDEHVAATSASGRRSSRRTAAGSSRRGSRESKRAKSGKSPEEAAASRRAVKLAVIWILILAVVGGGGAAAFIYLREEPQTRTIPVGGEELTFEGTKAELARQYLQRALQARTAIEEQLSNRNPQKAKDALLVFSDLIHQPELGGDVPNPDPENPALGSIDLALRAAELRAQQPEFKEAIEDLEDALQAERNLRALQQRMAQLKDIKDLDALQRDVENFMRNPVQPEGETSAANQDRFSLLITQIKAKIHDIDVERQRRHSQQTTEVIERVNSETQALISQSRYGEAIRAVERAEEAHPKAELGPIRGKIEKAAAEGWEKDRRKAEIAFRDATTAGVPESRKKQRLEDAIDILEGVVRNYGDATDQLQRFVREAEAMLRQYRAKL